jgi:alkanesulfonate monooxygenase SsuD/methylene tetrahydromethanopterin reductase-like flavin-dependent oxidoreductase (luciferase family)
MSAVAARTSRATIGHLVGANTFRNPALLAKMVTTIDHISGGRAVLGIGAAWMEPEHTGFGFEFGDRPGTRLRWLEEALGIVRGMLDGARPTVQGERYRTEDALNLPASVQPRIPILIGGSGPKVTLRLVAQYADMNNLGNPVEACLRNDAILVEHCQALGRDERQIERTVELQRVAVRDTRLAAIELDAELLARGDARVGEVRPRSGDAPADRLVGGNPDEVYEQLAPFVEAGYRHLICGFPAPFDEETMRRIALDVRPRLEALITG